MEYAKKVLQLDLMRLTREVKEHNAMMETFMEERVEPSSRLVNHGQELRAMIRGIEAAMRLIDNA